MKYKEITENGSFKEISGNMPGFYERKGTKIQVLAPDLLYIHKTRTGEYYFLYDWSDDNSGPSEDFKEITKDEMRVELALRKSTVWKAINE